MKYKILIDKSTIMENPNAGRTEMIEVLPSTTTFKIECLPKKVEVNFLINKYAETFTSGEDYSIIETISLSDGDAYIVEDWIKNNKDVVIKYSRETKSNLIRHQHYPKPLYLFEYEPAFVECKSCHAKFEHKYLQTEYSDDIEIENVCPICNEWYCCETEFQDIAEAIMEYY